MNKAKNIDNSKNTWDADDDLNDFVFVGIWALSDPLRPEIKRTLSKTKDAGIKTIIITGDNKYQYQSDYIIKLFDKNFPKDVQKLQTLIQHHNLTSTKSENADKDVDKEYETV